MGVTAVGGMYALGVGRRPQGYRLGRARRTNARVRPRRRTRANAAQRVINALPRRPRALPVGALTRFRKFMKARALEALQNMVTMEDLLRRASGRHVNWIG